MARGNDSGLIVMSIIGLIAVILLVLGEAFSGNFTPILVVIGIILLIYIFFKVLELRQHKTATDKIDVVVNPESNFNFPRFILILLLIGFFLAGLFFDKSSCSNSGSETVPVEYPIPSPEIIDSIARVDEVPKKIKWISKDFANTVFQIPENLVFQESLSSNNSKIYIDYDSNISMVIVAELLNDKMSGITIDDFADNISILANNINEENKRNFDDIILMDYKMSYLGNSKAIKIEESSKKASGLKNIDMTIVSYQIISKPYYYKVTFSYPKEKPEFLETFEEINKTFDFNNSLDEENEKTANNNAEGVYTVNPNSIGKVYFYNNPNERYKRKGYLIGNEVVFVEEIVNGFGYIDYTNSRGLKSKGWIKMSCLLKSEN